MSSPAAAVNQDRRPRGGDVIAIGDDGHVVYDFNRLDEHRFEDLCRALALRVLG
jgi:hypothetical protein